MKYVVTLIVCSLLLSHPNFAQLEIGVQIGTSNYLGDLAPTTSRTSVGQTHFSPGIFVRYNIGKWISVRGGFNYGKISAKDSKSVSRGRRARNLSFRSHLYEASLIGEFNILGYSPCNSERLISPYILIGIAGFSFNPQAYHNGRWVDLQPLGTEGQYLDGGPEPYELFQFSIPMGAGMKYAVNSAWSVGFEVGVRKTFTDYLDDVSTSYPDLNSLAATNGALAAELSWRGDEINSDANNPRVNGQRGDRTDLDAYVFSTIFVSYNLGCSNSSYKFRRRSTRRCPTF